MGHLSAIATTPEKAVELVLKPKELLQQRRRIGIGCRGLNAPF
jgi:hypothetical protein